MGLRVSEKEAIERGLIPAPVPTPKPARAIRATPLPRVRVVRRDDLFPRMLIAIGASLVGFTMALMTAR